MILLWICLSAIDQHVNTDRTFLDSLYFGMITISTVGFGDFIWSSESCYRVGIHFLIFSMVCFVFSMGTFASCRPFFREKKCPGIGRFLRKVPFSQKNQKSPLVQKIRAKEKMPSRLLVLPLLNYLHDSVFKQLSCLQFLSE